MARCSWGTDCRQIGKRQLDISISSVRCVQIEEKIKLDVVSKTKLGKRSRKKNRSRGLLRKLMRGSNLVKEKHKRRENSKELVHQCEICRKIFNEDTKLTHHTSIHFHNCQKKCCEQIFSTKYDLNHHVKFLHKNLEECFNCQYKSRSGCTHGFSSFRGYLGS